MKQQWKSTRNATSDLAWTPTPPNNNSNFSVSVSYTIPRKSSSSIVLTRDSLSTTTLPTTTTTAQQLPPTRASYLAAHRGEEGGCDHDVDDNVDDATLGEMLLARLSHRLENASSEPPAAFATRRRNSKPQSQSAEKKDTTTSGAFAFQVIRRLPFEVFGVVLEYCDVRSVCRLSCVSKRFQIMTQSAPLWRAVARRCGITADCTKLALKEIKQMVANYIVHTREHLRETLQHEQTRLSQVEQRMRQRQTEVPSFAAGFVQEAAQSLPRVAEQVTHVEKQLTSLADRLTKLELLRIEVMSAVSANKAQLSKNTAELERLVTRTSEDRRSHELADLIASFEKRICRLVLHPLKDLPVVLRRGTSTFHALELLALQVGQNEVGAELRMRWSAFKRYCPLTNEYYAIVETSELPPCDPQQEPRQAALPPQVQSRLLLVQKTMKMTDREIAECLQLL